MRKAFSAFGVLAFGAFMFLGCENELASLKAVEKKEQTSKLRTELGDITQKVETQKKETWYLVGSPGYTSIFSTCDGASKIYIAQNGVYGVAIVVIPNGCQ